MATDPTRNLESILAALGNALPAPDCLDAGL